MRRAIDCVSCVCACLVTVFAAMAFAVAGFAQTEAAAQGSKSVPPAITLLPSELFKAPSDKEIEKLFTCELIVHKTLVSPDKKHKAVIFEKSCGATAVFNSQLSIVPVAHKFSPGVFPPVLVVRGRHEISARWKNAKSLAVTLRTGVRIARRLGNQDGIQLAYIYSDKVAGKDGKRLSESDRSVLHVPPGADVDMNMQEAADHAGERLWFAKAFHPHGPWDYKFAGPQYHAYSNFNYAAVARAFGFRDDVVINFSRCLEVQNGTSRMWWKEKEEGGNKLRKALFGDRLAEGSEDYPSCVPLLVNSDTAVIIAPR